MRPTRSASCLPPVVPGAFLALSVLLCGGSIADAATAAVLIQHSQERAGQLTRDPEAVASLLACFGEAGKDVQKRLGGQQAAVAFRVSQAPRLTKAARPAANPDHALPHEVPLTLTLIDLPPPASTP